MRSVLSLCLCFLVLAPLSAEEILYRGPRFVVTEVDGIRILKSRTAQGDSEQSRMAVAQPHRPIYPYTKAQLLALGLRPEPKRVLVVGLGGGSLTRALAATLPQAEIESVELDAKVVRLARRFFGYRDGGRLKTYVQDARKFLENSPGPYDLIYLDAFDGTEIPYPLRTVEFYRLVCQNLTSTGMAVSNFHLRSQLHARDLATFKEVFNHTVTLAGMGQQMWIGSAAPLDVSAGEGRLKQLNLPLEGGLEMWRDSLVAEPEILPAKPLLDLEDQQRDQAQRSQTQADR